MPNSPRCVSDPLLQFHQGPSCGVDGRSAVLHRLCGLDGRSGTGPGGTFSYEVAPPPNLQRPASASGDPPQRPLLALQHPASAGWTPPDRMAAYPHPRASPGSPRRQVPVPDVACLACVSVARLGTATSGDVSLLPTPIKRAPLRKSPGPQ